ncbi:tryptophan-rich sensory protein [Trichocoleus desertorum AS-A10]|uniref:TspO/MBR family protein n=1 Tax=Trichocoleus desertorum TaxID=1481672 RepID=UPI0032975D0E
MVESWMIIGGITFLVALGAAWIRPRDTVWAVELQRPLWLFFEPLIPVIWTFVFSCGAASAYLVWEKNPGSLQMWLLMALYLLLEVITVAYIPLTLRLRNIKVGVVLGGIGVVLGVFLASSILSISGWAVLLLLPYLIWSPIGTYATLEMMRLNPEAAH